MTEGWKCPSCGTCYAPWVAQCARCLGGQTNDVLCRHTWTADTWGMYCLRCGTRITETHPASHPATGTGGFGSIAGYGTVSADG